MFFEQHSFSAFGLEWPAPICTPVGGSVDHIQWTLQSSDLNHLLKILDFQTFLFATIQHVIQKEKSSEDLYFCRFIVLTVVGSLSQLFSGTFRQVL